MAGATTISPASDPVQIQAPAKLKGRKRILQSLHRISSSPSLAKMGRTPSSGYRGGGRGSISCVSLSSSVSYCHSYGNSYSSQSSGGFSTAPTSVVSTPGQDSPFLDPKARIRFIGLDAGQNGPASVPVPAELRPTSSRGGPLPATPELSEVVDDYFSRPLSQTAKSHRRPRRAFWADLPDEIKMHVLGYLKPKELVGCSSVSKAWHKMCFDGQLWPSLDTTEFYRDIPGESLAKIITAAGPFVRDLNLRGCVQLRERIGTEAMSEACQNIINLSIEGCRLDRSEIHSFLVRNSKLAYLNVSGLAVVTNSTMKVLAQSCPRLEHLNVSWCNNVDTRGLRRIVESCSQLKDLRAGEVRGFGDHEFMLELFQKNNLERLVLNHCDSITDESLQILLEGVDAEIDPLTSRAIVPPRKLKHLDLTRCRGLTDDGIKALAGNVPHLEGLQLSKCSVLTDAALSELLASLPRLTHLDLEELEELTNSTLQILARSPCTSTLEHLCISYCENLGDVGMLPVMKNCTRLRNVEMDNTRVSDLVLAEAAGIIRQRNKALHTATQRRPVVGLRMVVYDCQNVTWTGIREVLSRNAEITRPGANSKSPCYPTEVIQLKCFYGWQMTVDEHMKRVLRGDLASASRLERKWAEYMIANEEAGVGGAGSRRRRRRAREAALLHADEEEGGMGLAGIGRRRRARSGGCTIM
ncbi:RNI-like protein [Xylona heveae TC161]|uniref:RNI-like protein n=1 Tax=Xylona heveae (strain CBS 132557 / TC161) TaxID=1328760 RepID=A0A165GHY2_XYLHT|nr:RNI-like protein [Xylona heveae TC161]KZF22203.1 RNI-like protein [Xylona heveae TC161]